MKSQQAATVILFLCLVVGNSNGQQYFIAPDDDANSCDSVAFNGTCFTLFELINQVDLISGGANLTLNFLSGEHYLRGFLFAVYNFNNVTMIGHHNLSSIVTIFPGSTLDMTMIQTLRIEGLFFQYFNPFPGTPFIILRRFDSFIHITSTLNVTISGCHFIDFEVDILHTQSNNTEIRNATFSQNGNFSNMLEIESNHLSVESSDFIQNIGDTGNLIHIIGSESATIESSVFNQNRAHNTLIIESDNLLITNTEFFQNTAETTMKINSTSANIDNISLTNNSAGVDGAITIDSINVYLSNSRIENNQILGAGTLNVASKTTFISHTDFIANTATVGGAIAVPIGQVYISNCRLEKNSAVLGGAIYIADRLNVNQKEEILVAIFALGGRLDYEILVSGSGQGTGSLSVSESILIKNMGRYDGGALFVDSTGYIQISHSLLSENSAGNGLPGTGNNLLGSGGVMFTGSSDATLKNCDLSNNTAFTRGGVIDAGRGRVFISNCRLSHNRAGIGGAVNSGNLLSMFNCEISSNTVISRGGAIRASNAQLFNCTIVNNYADFRGGAIQLFGGPSTHFAIESCRLFNNSARYRGGAISVPDSNLILISNCDFRNNQASVGGAVYCNYAENVSFFDCVFSGNSGDEGVALYSHTSTVSIRGSLITDHAIGPTLFIQQSNITFDTGNLFHNNRDLLYLFNSQAEFTGQTTLSNNYGRQGGAISTLQSQIEFNSQDGKISILNNSANLGGGLFLRESTLTVTQPIEISLNYAENGGGVYAYFARILFSGTTAQSQSVISNNTAEHGGGIYAISSTIELRNSYVEISGNTAYHNGGALNLQQNTKLYLLKLLIEGPNNELETALMITGNSAQLGGGIFVADTTESADICRGTTMSIFSECFIQTLKLYTFDDAGTLGPFVPGIISQITPEEANNVNTLLVNNTAHKSGSAIYGGLLDRCFVHPSAEVDSSLNGTSYIRNTVSISSTFTTAISSDPLQVTLCNETHSGIQIKKGEAFRIRVAAIDQAGHKVNASILSSVANGNGRLREGQAEQQIGDECTDLEFNVFSSEDSAQLNLHADGPCSNQGVSLRVISISFLPCTCPIGFQPINDPTECACECNPVLQLHEIRNCFPDKSIVQFEINQWIGVANSSGFVVHECSFDYCADRPINISLSSSQGIDRQCANNRSGILCGQCEEGLSLVLGTSNCQQCSNLFLLLLIPFAVAGVLLIVLILLLRLNLATGTVHGLIFYANVLAASRSIFLPFNNFLTVFISWVNLDLGIETCFYNGMNSQAKVLLQLVFPGYLIILLVLIIILSNYFNSLTRFFSNKNPVASLATVYFLSHSRLLRTIIAALQFTHLEYPDSSSDIVWLYDSNVLYFTPSHAPRFIAALLIILIGLFFTFLLFFGQWLPRCYHWKLMKWTKNTYYTGFMDAFHAPFTPRHRYWFGLLLLALTTQNLVVALSPNRFSAVLSAGCISIMILFWKLFNKSIYKSWLTNGLETLFLINLSILAFGTFFVNTTSTSGSQFALSNISMAIAFVLFVIIACCNLYNYVLKDIDVLKKALNLLSKISLGQIEKGIKPKEQVEMQRKEITPKESTSNKELETYRDHDLDILAPITTEDYRTIHPTPPTKQKVTHSVVEIQT